MDIRIDDLSGPEIACLQKQDMKELNNNHAEVKSMPVDHAFRIFFRV
jgi:hypothetical protein